MEYTGYIVISLVALAILIVGFRLKHLQKDFTQERKTSREQRHVVENDVRNARNENEKAIVSLKKEIVELQSEYAKLCEKSSQEQQQTQHILSELKQSFCDVQSENEQSTVLLNKQLAEIKSEYAKLCEKSSQDKQQTQHDISDLEQQIHQLASSLEEAQTNYRELKKQIEFFTKIKVDSAELNANSPSPMHSETSDKDIVDPIEGLDEEQKAAFDLVINSNRNVFITGKAGTGKSYLLRMLVKSITKKTVVLAPTGIAALNIQGATLHSTFGYRNLVDLDTDQIAANTIRLKSEKKKLLLEAETIIIDEISMVRADVFTKIDKILRVLNKSDKVFGGKQIVIFGDLFQIPPIVKRNEYQYLIDTYGGRHFFHSPAYKNADFCLFELTINHRQKDDVIFFDILNRVREGNVSPDDIDVLNNRASADITAERRIVKLYSHKADAESINTEELSKIPAKQYTYECTVSYSKKNLTQNMIDDLFPISATLHLKLGALVMMVNNDLAHRWVNGTLGIVSYLDDNELKVTIDGYEYEILPVKFEQKEATYENGKITYQTTCEVVQFPVILAYAITIHKSQGMTYNKVGCDINKCFEPGQAYVALSRCTNLEGLYLLGKVSPHSLRVDSEVVEFYHYNFH